MNGMQVLVLLANPRPASFSHALAQRTVATLAELGHRPVLQDLYDLGFDPIIKEGEARRSAELPTQVAEAVRHLTEADGIVVAHPNWWGMPPAILVGWIDRAIRVDSAYRFDGAEGEEGVPTGLLKARTAVVFNTSDTNTERELATFGDPLERIWRDCIFGFCGVTDVRRRTFGVMVTSTADDRDHWLDEAEAMIREAYPAG